jgi:hypothetical protein
MKEYKERLHSSKTLFIADVLLYYVIRRQIISNGKLYSIEDMCDSITTRTRLVKFNTDRLSQLLIQSAVEHLTAFRLVMSRDYSSVFTIVTTDYQAMYAYKCGLYQQCFQLCDSNIVTLTYATKLIIVFPIPSDLMLLMDDDSVSLIGLATLCGPTNHRGVTQLTVSMYLLARTKLKLRHSAASLINVLRLAIFAHNRHQDDNIVNRSIMAFVYRKTFVHLSQLLIQSAVEHLTAFPLVLSRDHRHANTVYITLTD